MFEHIKLMGTKPASIPLVTRAGTSIENQQAPEPDSQVSKIFRVLQHKHPGWKVRKEVCGIYNCAGLVWASRRTEISEEKMYLLILKEDGYRKLGPAESPDIGDIAIYRDNASRRVFHVAVVAQRMVGTYGLEQWWVLSKLNGQMGEVVHHALDFVDDQGPFAVEYWSDRH